MFLRSVALLIMLLGGISTQVAAQQPQPEVQEPPALADDVNAAMDINARNMLPNRQGIFAGINLNTLGVVISGKEYKGAVHEIPVFAGSQVQPVYELASNTRIRFHVDGEGVVRAIWIDGELQQ